MDRSLERKVPAGVVALLFISMFIVGMPLDGGVGQFREYYYSEDDRGESALKVRVMVVWGLIYLMSIYYLISRRSAFATTLKAMSFAYAYFGLIMLSTLWSTNLAKGLLDSAQMLMSLFMCSMFAWHYRDRVDAFLHTTARGLGAAQIVSLAFTIIYPTMAIEPIEARWAGIYGVPNYFGMLAFCSLWSARAAYNLSSGRERLLYLGLIVVSLVNLVGSRSVAAIVASITVLWLFAIRRFLRAKRNRISAIAITLLVGVLIAIVYYSAEGIVERILSAVGRNATLSGRVDIWSGAFSVIQSRLVTGYGYGTNTSDSGAFWRVTSVHNAYLEMLLAGGALVLGAFAVIVMQLSRRLVAAGCWVVRDLYYFVVFSSAALIINLAESYFMGARNPVFLIFFSIVGLLGLCRLGHTSNLGRSRHEL
jgi:exopolysaccharide production protein ExoQ